MKKLKTFEQFKNLNEDYTEAGEAAGLYDELAILMNKATEITGEDYDIPEDAMDGLMTLNDTFDEPDPEISDLVSKIEDTLEELDFVKAQALYRMEEEDDELDEGALTIDSDANITQNLPGHHVKPQDDLMNRAKKILGWDVKDLEVAVEQLRKLGTAEAKTLYKELVTFTKEEGGKLGTSLLKTIEESVSEDEYEEYLNGMYGTSDLMEDDEFEYLRNQADEDGNEWMYQGNFYGKLLRTYDPVAFNVGYREYERENE